MARDDKLVGRGCQSTIRVRVNRGWSVVGKIIAAAQPGVLSDKRRIRVTMPCANR